jgi:hypothetical protein
MYKSVFVSLDDDQEAWPVGLSSGSAIYGFDAMVGTIAKMVKAAKVSFLGLGRDAHYWRTSS